MVYSLEMTTSETLEALLKTGFRKDESYTRLKSVLNGADLVKFAKYKPEPSENERHFDDSWQFVETTKIREEVIQDDPSVKRRVKSHDRNNICKSGILMASVACPGDDRILHPATAKDFCLFSDAGPEAF